MAAAREEVLDQPNNTLDLMQVALQRQNRGLLYGGLGHLSYVASAVLVLNVLEEDKIVG